MAFQDDFGCKIMYECQELIDELKNDILEFGGDTEVAVWCRDYYGATLYVNYDFLEEEAPITPKEVKKGEFLKIMTMTALLMLLEEQNSL